MSRALSVDLRRRVVDAVEAGSSCRAAVGQATFSRRCSGGKGRIALGLTITSRQRAVARQTRDPGLDTWLDTWLDLDGQVPVVDRWAGIGSNPSSAVSRSGPV